MAASAPPAPGGDQHHAGLAGAHAVSRLLGRSRELAVIDGLFGTAAVRGAALMLSGEAGVGKSALLDAAALRASGRGFRVVRVVGSQFEESVGFSALNQILLALSEEIPPLPTRQAETLQAVRGISEGQPTELLAVANAAHALLTRAATQTGPLALIIDDVAWLDRPSAAVLGTVARSLHTGHAGSLHTGHAGSLHTGHAGSLALLAASRTGDESFLSSTGTPAYEVRALDDEAAEELVAERFPAMAARVRRRVVAEARGNPLALLELPVSLDDAQRTERGTLPAVLPLTERLKRIFSARVEALPDATRKLLLLAVLDGSGDLHILRQSLGGSETVGGPEALGGSETVGGPEALGGSETMGGPEALGRSEALGGSETVGGPEAVGGPEVLSGPETVGGPEALAALGPAERAGLVRVDALTGRLVFRHPLTRSAVMDLSTSAERRWGHLALAGEFPEGSERRARHLANAAVGPDDQVAALLHEVAYSTLRRGDAVGAITTLLRASELSSTGTARGRRLAEAACLGANITGDLHNVRALLDHAGRADPAGTGSLAAAAAAASQLLNGEGDVDTAHRLLVGAIDNHGNRDIHDIHDIHDNINSIGAVDNHDLPGGGGDTILGEAMDTLLLVCFFGGRPELWHDFDRAMTRFGPGTSDPLLPVARGAFGDPAHAALPVLDALDELVAGLHRETDPTRIIRTAIAGAYADRLPGCRSALRRVVDDGRNGGAITSAIEGLFLLANDAYTSGQWDELLETTEEGLRWCATYDYRLLACSGRFLRGLLAAARGDGDTARDIADRLVSWGNPRGLGVLRVYAAHVRALSALGGADFEAAYRHLRALGTPGRLPPHMPHALWLLLDFTEAAARTGRHAEAAAHVEAVRKADIPSISPRLAMLTDAAEAMATPDFVDHELFEAAIAAPGAERWPFDWARICLAYGERLRRARAGGAARVHLDAALSTFERLGAAPWSARAANELRASGIPVTAVVRGEEPRSPLTPQERQTARLAATGLTNKQIAARLFLSPRTVAAHLRGAFRKLNVTSRAGLRDALTGLSQPPPPPVPKVGAAGPTP